MQKRVEIAGGGFAGLSMAVALAQQGWSVRIFEAHETLREIGAGIFLWDNALEALESLGVLEAVRAASAQPSSTVVMRDNTETASNPANGNTGHRMWTITRQALHHILAERALSLGVTIETGARVVQASPEGRLKLADGREFSADLVIGADGIGSAVRESLGIPGDRSDFNYGIIRVLLELDDVQTDTVTDFWSMSPLPRRILAVPCDRRHLYLALMCAADDRNAAGLPFQVDTWKTAFPELSHYLERIVGDKAVTHYNVYSTIHVPRWTAGRCTLLGDAAHGMPPTMGQGAGSAIWNAVDLARRIAKSDDIKNCLSEWERICKPITLDTQKKSEELAAMGPARSERSKSELLSHGSNISEKVVQGYIAADLRKMLNFVVDPQSLVKYQSLDWYTTAWALIEARHADKVDRLQRPSSEHFPRVMLRLLTLNPHASTDQLQAALLHDALEPGHYTESELLDKGVLPRAVQMIQRISLPQDDRTYLQYIEDLAASDDAEAKEVKLADNYDAYDLFLLVGSLEGIERVRTQYHPSVSRLRTSLRQ